MSKFINALLATSALGIAHAAQAQAVDQPADTPPPAEEASSGGLGEIIVTARRTAESLQATPVAVTALTGDFLESQNILDMSSVPQFAPNFAVFQQAASPTAASIFIRGVGNNEPSSITEQAVGVYLDGVYVARSAGAIFDLVDLERIEVLRGPQGTLFGRNSIGGAIQLVSKKPGDQFGIEAKAGYGSFSEWYARTRIDTGDIAGTPIKASIAYQHRQRDGYVDNLLRPDNRDPGAINGDALFVALYGEFGKLTAHYTFDYNDRRSVPPYFQTVAATPDVINYFNQSPSFGGAPFLIDSNRLDEGLQLGFVDASGRDRVDSRAKVQGHALTLEYEASDKLTLKSNSAYRKFNQDTILTLSGQGDLRGFVLDPVTFRPAGIQSVNLINGYNAPQEQYQVSQEIQALGTSGEWSYVAGAYYFYEKSSEYNPQAFTFVLPGGQAGLNLSAFSAFGGTAESFAGFGQVSWRPESLNDKLELTGGVRYTKDTKTVTLGGSRSGEGKANFDNLSWLASVTYDITDDVMVYGRVSTGFRSGGFGPRADGIVPFDPETVIAYEAGIKSEFFDRRLRANFAAFYTDFKDQQISQFQAGTGGTSAVVVNAGKVSLMGVELEVTAQPVDSLTFDGSIGYVVPNYQEYMFRDPVTNELINVAHEVRFISSAKLNAHAGVQYTVPMSFGELSARLDYSYRSAVYWFALDRTTPFNHEIRSRPDHNLRARLALSDIELGGAKLEVAAWGDNLTDQENIDFGIDFGGLGFAGASYKKPRSFGFDVKVTY